MRNRLTLAEKVQRIDADRKKRELEEKKRLDEKEAKKKAKLQEEGG